MPESSTGRCPEGTGHRAQEQFLPHCGDGTALKFGSHKHIGLKRMQDYVCSAVQIESELVENLLQDILSALSPFLSSAIICSMRPQSQ